MKCISVDISSVPYVKRSVICMEALTTFAEDYKRCLDTLFQEDAIKKISEDIVDHITIKYIAKILDEKSRNHFLNTACKFGKFSSMDELLDNNVSLADIEQGVRVAVGTQFVLMHLENVDHGIQQALKECVAPYDEEVADSWKTVFTEFSQILKSKVQLAIEPIITASEFAEEAEIH